MEDLDRHQGWYTEFKDKPEGMFKRGGRGTDYVVRTSFVVDEKQKSVTEPTNRRKLSITLRFRSLLKRRNSEPDRVKKHSLPFEDANFDALHRGVAALSVTKSQECSNRFQSKLFGRLKPTHSDSCLRSTVCPSHSGFMQPHYSPGPVSSGSDSTTETSYAQRDQLEWRQRIQSLSTGNLCCLFALQCLPSLEFTDTAWNYSSPVTTGRRASVPTTPALKSKSREDGFTLHLMKHHPCYKDSRKDLGEWVKQTLSQKIEDSSLSTQGEHNEKGFLLHPQVWKDKHVRFADEDTCSLSTLNSLSASSSARSLTSLCSSFLSPSPLGSSFNVSSLDTGGNMPSNTVVGPASPYKPKTGSFGFAPKGSSRDFTRIKPLTLARQLWSNQKLRFHKSRKNTTPLVTVNIIQDYSEPPEVPNHVLKQLQRNRQPKVFWKPLFPSPNTFGDFQQNLMKKGVCLTKLTSSNLHSISLEIHVLSLSPFDNDPPSDVRLRFTLNDWQTYSESPPLYRVQRKREQVSHCDFPWIEIYEGSVKLSWSQLTNSNSLSQRFEFAVVARKDGGERWDNNETRNYVCQRYTTPCENSVCSYDDSDFYD